MVDLMIAKRSIVNFVAIFRKAFKTRFLRLFDPIEHGTVTTL